MKTVKNLVGIHKGREALIIGAGATIKRYHNEISKFVKTYQPITFGINNMNSEFIPQYHLWTNTQRFRTYGESITDISDILLGSNIPIKIIKKVIEHRPYTLINYTDKEGVPMKYRDGIIYGFYRTAGNLAIMIAHLMGVERINIVGMDGYTYYSKDELEEGKGSQHCYGDGHTDTADYETCLYKDGLIKKVLQNIKDIGVDFKIITPTKYEDFYDSFRLHST